MMRELQPHEQLMQALRATPLDETKYLINVLNERKISTFTEVYLCLFVMSLYHPALMKSSPIQKLSEKSFLSASVDELLIFLNRPHNADIKKIHDQFVAHVLEQASLLEKPIRPKKH